MSREIDRRDFSVNKVTPAREDELSTIASDVSARLPGPHRLQITDFDTSTGNPRVIVSESAPAEKGNYIQRALEHMQSISPALGLAATQPAEFVTDPNIQQTSSGAVTVHLKQNYKSIPIFHATQTVRFAPDGTLKDTVGSSVTIAQERAIAPKLSVQEAMLKAAQHVAVPDADEQGTTDQFGQPLNLTSVDLTDFVPKVIATFPDKADRPTVLEAGPFGDEIKGALVWFPLGDDLRLAWDFIITMPNYEGQYRTIVDGDSGEILYCRQLILTAVARGNVFHVDGDGARQMTDFPRALADYGLPIPGDLPAAFPDDWVTEDRTIGNSTNAHQGNSGPTFRGAVQNGVLTFDPANPVGVDQLVLNLFYYCCFMHDFFYLLGFRESDGNFQHGNFGIGGLFWSDRVDARVHPGIVHGTANMSTPIDGFNPIMNMGLVAHTNRHTALDSTVVFHEFMHGVTNRLVGGPQEKAGVTILHVPSTK
jgi:extracellular elastinolytic metalloproteinase